jgi:glycosyltransferase involved in cell wall biosynthesis
VVFSLSREVYERKQRTLIDTAEFRVLKGLAENGHEVHVLMPQEKGTRKDFLYNGIIVHEFKNMSVPKANSLVSKPLSGLVQYAQQLLFLFFSLKKSLETVKSFGKPDLVYGYMPRASITAYFVSRLYSIPNITRLFGTFLYTSLTSPRDLFLRMGYLELLSFKLPCRYLIITNDGTRGDETARRLRVQDARVKYFMDGADFLRSAKVDTTNLREKLKVSKKTRLLLSVCRLAKWKRVDRIIEAMPRIVKMNENAKVFLIGEGEERKNLELLCDQLGVRDFVVFLGATAHSRVREYMFIADIFISLYDFSNLSDSLFEAMTCGVSVVALDTGRTSQVIKNEVNGVLLRALDLEKLPDIINRLLTDDENRNRLGKEAREYALKNFWSWEERVQTEVSLVEDLFGNASQIHSNGSLKEYE